MLYLFITRLTVDNKFHAILFREAPLPGGHVLESGQRLKSWGTNPRGFDTIGEALSAARVDVASAIEKGQPVRVCKAVLALEGDDTEAHSCLFTNADLEELPEVT